MNITSFQIALDQPAFSETPKIVTTPIDFMTFLGLAEMKVQLDLSLPI